MGKKILICFGMASAAPTLTFDRPTATKKDIAFNPFNAAGGKDFVQDYESKDGNYKYHAEVHYANDDNKDGQATELNFLLFHRLNQMHQSFYEKKWVRSTVYSRI